MFEKRPFYTVAIGYAAVGVILNAPSLSGVECSPGTYSIDGINCIEASPGFYVPSSGATEQIPAPLGRFVPGSGATAAIEASPGTYVPAEASSFATLASEGYYVPDFGASSQTPSPKGQFIPIQGATSLDDAVDAPIGKYVAEEGSSEATLAPRGTFVDSVGATAPTPAPPGRYVPGVGATEAIVAGLGSYVPVEGATSATLASEGYYVPEEGSSFQTPSPAGKYIPISGATSLDDAIDAPVGKFVAEEGSSEATPAPPGSYVPNTGSSFAILASPGYFVPSAGSTVQSAAPPGYYVPAAGATQATVNPAGTWTGPASVAPRAASSGLKVDGDPIVGPRFESDRSAIVDLGTWISVVQFRLNVTNSADFLGGGDPLTQLTLKSLEVSGEAASLVRQLSDPLPLILDEGEREELRFQISEANGASSFQISILTDEEAALGSDGKRFEFEFNFSVNQSAEYEAFLETYFTEAELLDVESTRFLADFDGDGIDNGMEFVFGTNPKDFATSTEAVWLPRTLILREPEGDQLALAFSLPVSTIGSIELSIQVSDTVEEGTWATIASREGNGEWVGDAVVEIDEPSDGRVSVLVKDLERLSAELDEKRFMRLEARVNGDVL